VAWDAANPINMTVPSMAARQMAVKSVARPSPRRLRKPPNCSSCLRPARLPGERRCEPARGRCPAARYHDLGPGYDESRINSQRRQRALIRQLEQLTGQKAALQPAA
jgi:hypothetical protein